MSNWSQVCLNDINNVEAFLVDESLTIKKKNASKGRKNIGDLSNVVWSDDG